MSSEADLSTHDDVVDAVGDPGPRPGHRRRRRVLLTVVPVLALALVFTGGLLTGQRLDDDVVAATEPPTAPTETVTVTATPGPEPAVAPVRPSTPTRLIIPSLDIKAGVVRIDLSSDAVLEPPADPDLVGWWTGSAEPGDRVGRVVLTGHTVSSGEGALDPLPDLTRGKVVLVTETGRHRYRVTDSLVVDYADVAENARAIFGQTEESPDGARLILVTCTNYNGRVYESNAIIVAEPILSRAPR